jgi:GMP synthase-like glutamine amidotransferase
MRLLVVMNQGDTALGVFSQELKLRFSSIEFAYREEIELLQTSEMPDTLLLLGSDWSVYDEFCRASVEIEMSLVRNCALNAIPILGICFGAQVISQAFGGDVFRAIKPEIGWRDVESLDRESPVTGRWMQWHYDSFTAPRGFDVLAENSAGVQAIRLGRTLGVQFHPEVDADVVTRWSLGRGSAELAAAGVTPELLLDELARPGNWSEKSGRRLLKWFLEVVSLEAFVPWSSN